MLPLHWRPLPPTLDDLQDGPCAYWWARGWNFNRPVIVRVNAGARRVPAQDADPAIDAPLKPHVYRAELNFEFFCDGFARPIWAADLHALPGLQWCGPIQQPMD